jgi:hypothetical protein
LNTCTLVPKGFGQGVPEVKEGRGFARVVTKKGHIEQYIMRQRERRGGAKSTWKVNKRNFYKRKK